MYNSVVEWPQVLREASSVARARPSGPGPDQKNITNQDRLNLQTTEDKVQHEQIQKMGQGFYWQDLRPGMKLETYRRTITETDLVNFISVTGMLEAIFIDAEYEASAIQGRPVPAALTYTLIEGFILQSMIQGTGLAMLELVQHIHAPVKVGDSIAATVEVTEVKPTSKSGRAVVTSVIEVFNQRREKVMTYTAKRLLAGRGTSAG
jgi:3-hydroxybutyryl-CoA dehydratase